MRPIQAKDISDDAIVAMIERFELREGRWMLWSDFEEPYLGLPHKLMLAKMRKLILKGRVDGCACGCRGDFTVRQNARRPAGDLVTIARPDQ